MTAHIPDVGEILDLAVHRHVIHTVLLQHLVEVAYCRVHLLDGQPTVLGHLRQVAFENNARNRSSCSKVLFGKRDGGPQLAVLKISQNVPLKVASTLSIRDFNEARICT